MVDGLLCYGEHFIGTLFKEGFKSPFLSGPVYDIYKWIGVLYYDILCIRP